ncbi:MAG: hypothetical protein ABIH20_06575 [Candidatus Diapherotrites archaeon]
MNQIELLSLDPKTKSTKELIIHTLGNRWPLSAKEIHNSLIREQGLNTTYQATHKNIQELESHGAIQSIDKKYQLSKEWIGKSKNYFDSLNLSYEENEQIINEEKTLKFNNYTDFPLALGNMFNSTKLAGPKYTEVYAMTRHLFWPLKFSFKDFELCKSVGAISKPHVICQGNSSFDKLIKKYYGIAKWSEAIIGADIDVNEDIMVQGHTIIQVKYSEETKQKLDKIYQNVFSITDLFKQYMKNNTNDLEIEMKITQNPQLAEIARQNIKKQMEEHK